MENEQSISVLKEFGATHLIMGVESFENEHLVSSLKSCSGIWTETVFGAMDLCDNFLTVILDDVKWSRREIVKSLFRRW